MTSTMRRIFLGIGSATALLLVAAQPFAAQSPSGAVCLGAEPEALDWLDRMSRSSHEVDYRGVVTFQRGDDMQVMQIVHSVSGGSTSEQMTRLTGQGAQVERADHPLECLHPGHKLLQVGSSLHEGGCGIAEHYRFAVSDGERVLVHCHAGRSRSVCIVARYLMWKSGLSGKAALEIIKSKREIYLSPGIDELLSMRIGGQ